MSLQDLVQGWAARGFADFPGLAIDGSIPLKQELVNQLIAEFLNSPPAASPGRPGIPEPLRPVLLQMIKPALACRRSLRLCRECHTQG